MVLCLITNYSAQSQLLQFFYDRISPVPFQNYYLLCYVANGSLVFYFVAWVACVLWEKWRNGWRKRKQRRSGQGNDSEQNQRISSAGGRQTFSSRLGHSDVHDQSDTVPIHSPSHDSNGSDIESSPLNMSSISPMAVNHRQSDDILKKWKWWSHEDVESMHASPNRGVALFASSNQRSSLAQQFQALSKWKRTFIVAFFLAPMQVSSAWLWYFSLDLIPVSLNMALYQSSVVFVFILGFFILRERMDFLKLTILTSIVTGVVLMFLGGSQDDKHKVYDRSLLGCVCVVGSALLVSMYTVLYTKFMPSSTSISTFFLFQSFMGVVILVFCWPPIVILHLVGMEPIPFDSVGWGYMGIVVGASVCTFTYSAFMAGALTITGSAVYVTVASLLVIPVSTLIDALWHEQHFQIMTIIGVVLILLGSILQNVIQITNLEWCGWDLTTCVRGLRQKRADFLVSKREYGVLEEGIFAL